MEQLRKLTEDSVNAFSLAVILHPEYVFTTLTLLFALSVIMLIYNIRQNARTSKEVEDMKKRLQLDQMYADGFGDVLFDMLCSDTIDRHEYRRACRRFGIAYRLGDLLVRKNDKRGRKHRILRACELIHRTPSAVGKIPGPRIGEQVPYAPPKVRKTYVVVGKVLLRRKPAI